MVNGSGYDEATLTGPTTVFTVENGKVKKSSVKPAQFGFGKRKEGEFAVADSAQSARVITQILDGTEKGAKKDLVVLNAGLAIYANMRVKSMKEGIAMARQSIDSGKALAKLKELARESNI